MPFQKRGSLLAKLAVTGAALAGLAALPSGGAAADAPCNFPEVKQVFSGYGDTGYYYLATGGAFEGTLNWKKSGSPSVVSMTDDIKLSSETDKSSARIPSGSSITSGRFCVSADFPHLRFVAKSLGTGNLDARVDLYDPSSGALLSSATTTIPAAEHGSWAPTRLVSLNTAGMAADVKAEAQVTLVSRGDWLTNDVYIDPYAK